MSLVTKILDKKMLDIIGKFDDVETVTFPFTADADGIFLGIVTPPGTAVSYVYIKDNTDNIAICRGSSTGSNQYTVVFPVVKGHEYRIDASSNYAFNSGARVFPFIGGGTP